MTYVRTIALCVATFVGLGGGGIDSLAAKAPAKAPVALPGLTCEDITSEDACGYFTKKCGFNKDLNLCFTQENPSVPDKKGKGKGTMTNGGG